MASNKSVLYIAIILLVAAVFISMNTPKHTSEEPIELGVKEILEYEGKLLSSVDDFRENSIKGPQYIEIDDYTLEVVGLVSEEKEYTYEEIIEGFQPYKKIVTLNCVEGWSATILWEGVLVKEVIGSVKPSANTIIFYAEDGYSTSFPVEYIMDNDIIMAYKMNEAVMMPERGFPFELVAESKWGYKWIKWITKIELSDDSDYSGFWEQRGYSNTGNLNESFRG